MTTLQQLISGINELEQQLSCDIARVATELEPLPDDRNTSELESAWKKASSSRRKLAIYIRKGLRQIKDRKETETGYSHELRAARKELRTAQTKLRGWSRLEEMFQAQLVSEPLELTESNMTPIRELKVIDQVSALFFEAMHTAANPSANVQEIEAENHGCHLDIPWPMPWFSEWIGAVHRICLALRRQRPLRFLDVGSGGGMKVLAATTCFEICHGLEYEKSTVISGQRFLDLVAPGRCKLIHGDALEFQDYGEYDVIYFYKPLKINDKMIQMEKRIFAQAKPGTVLIAVYGLITKSPQDYGIRKLTHYIYITGMSEDEAFEIGEIARRMGPMVPGRISKFKVEPPFKFDYWTPILEVSARNGYYP